MICTVLCLGRVLKKSSSRRARHARLKPRLGPTAEAACGPPVYGQGRAASLLAHSAVGDLQPFFSILLVLAGVSTLPGQSPPAAENPNTLTEAERDAGWRLLFDGRSLAGWRGLGRDTVPGEHWVVEDGAIKKIAGRHVARQADGQPIRGGDLMTEIALGDFELIWEWKLTPGANSGVKYNVSEEFSLTHASNHAALGFEYQMLDDERHEDGRIASHRAGSLYDLIAPAASKRLRPVGEWNRSRIVFRGAHGEHWLNGEKIVEFDLGTARMDSLLARSKYHVFPGFADRRRGHVVLQDHGDEVYFRSIKVREP